jgi:dTDP-glucose pyrophosphorylase
MKALILAAGFGTRLAPHTRTIPKALFPVAGIPVLERMITHLKRAGCTGIAVNAHHLADRIQSYLAKNDFGVPVTLSREPEILGTGGAIRHLAGYWDNDPFIVVNADIVTDIDLAEVYHRHLDQDASVTLVMHDRAPFNQVWVDDRNRIAGFERYAHTHPSDQHGNRKRAFTGIHVMDTGIIPRIPGEGFSDIISVYRQMVDEGVPIRAHEVSGHYWQDMGSPERYRDAVVDAMAPGVFHSAFPDDAVSAFQCRRLAGDGSDRNWFRLTAGRRRMILADHGITPTDRAANLMHLSTSAVIFTIAVCLYPGYMPTTDSADWYLWMIWEAFTCSRSSFRLQPPNPSKRFTGTSSTPCWTLRKMQRMDSTRHGPARVNPMILN